LEDGYVRELAELWQYSVVENKPELFEPPGLVHVCRGGRGYDSSVKGNCFKYHEMMNEIPCTPRETCQLRDKFRNAQNAETRKIRLSEKVSEEEQARIKRYESEQERFTKWCRDMGWGSY
jgi:hypothetical protein